MEVKNINIFYFVLCDGLAYCFNIYITSIPIRISAFFKCLFIWHLRLDVLTNVFIIFLNSLHDAENWSILVHMRHSLLVAMMLRINLQRTSQNTIENKLG